MTAALSGARPKAVAAETPSPLLARLVIHLDQ